MPMKLIYYTDFTGRANAVCQMLAEAKMDYEWVMDDAVCSCKGSETATAFAPPIVVDGDKTIGQSVALSVFVGKKCGFDKGVADEILALQYMLDVNDVLDGFFQNKSKGVKELKTFLTGGRFALWAGNVERCIKGPFYFGDTATYVDYHMAATFQMVDFMCLDAIGAKCGNVWEKYPKLSAAKGAICGLESVKAIGKPPLPPPYVMTPEQVEEYAAA